MLEKVLKAVDKFYKKYGYTPAVESGTFHDYWGIAIFRKDGTIFTVIYPFLT